MEQDPVDVFVEQWKRERPELDPSPLAVVSRVLMLYKFLERSADRALSPFGLTLWQFDVLAALRRSGPPFQLAPSELTRLVTLTSGAMTNRIDRLEALGLVRRDEDPEDRRGVLICLTTQGRKLADRAISARLEVARQNVARLTKQEFKALAELLRTLILTNAPEFANRTSALRNRASWRTDRQPPGKNGRLMPHGPRVRVRTNGLRNTV